MQSENAGRLVKPVTVFVTSSALTHLDSAIAYGKAQGLVPAGTDRMFMTRVLTMTGHSAIVGTCDDGSKVIAAYRATGRLDPGVSAPPSQAYIYETWDMVQLAGHWAISSCTVASLPSAAAQACQP